MAMWSSGSEGYIFDLANAGLSGHGVQWQTVGFPNLCHLVRRRQHVREPWGPDEPVELANKKREKTCVNSEQKYSESGETGNGYFFFWDGYGSSKNVASKNTALSRWLNGALCAVFHLNLIFDLENVPGSPVSDWAWKTLSQIRAYIACIKVYIYTYNM